MKAFRNLKLIGSAKELERLIDLIEKSLENGWERDREKESKHKTSSKVSYIIFTCSQLFSRPAGALFFAFDKNGYLSMRNIQPNNAEKWGEGVDRINRYNKLLNEFQTQFIEPAAQGLDIRVVTTPDERSLENSMSSEMVQLLKSFSAAANKTSGGTHPCDEERFFDFVIQAHKEDALLDEYRLQELLLDDEWAEDHAFRLSCNYRFGREFLKRYMITP